MSIKTIQEVLSAATINIHPSDYEKFKSEYDINSVSESELKEIKTRYIYYLLLNLRKFQLGFSLTINQKTISSNILAFENEFVTYFRQLQEDYLWLLKEVPASAELLSPLWAKEYSNDDILNIIQNLQNVIDKIPSKSESLSKSIQKREELEKMGCSVGE